MVRRFCAVSDIIQASYGIGSNMRKEIAMLRVAHKSTNEITLVLSIRPEDIKRTTLVKAEIREVGAALPLKEISSSINTEGSASFSLPVPSLSGRYLITAVYSDKPFYINLEIT